MYNFMFINVILFAFFDNLNLFYSLISWYIFVVIVGTFSLVFCYYLDIFLCVTIFCDG